VRGGGQGGCRAAVGEEDVTEEWGGCRARSASWRAGAWACRKCQERCKILIVVGFWCLLFVLIRQVINF